METTSINMLFVEDGEIRSPDETFQCPTCGSPMAVQTPAGERACNNCGPNHPWKE